MLAFLISKNALIEVYNQMIAKQEKPKVDMIPPVANTAIYKAEKLLNMTEIK